MQRASMIRTAARCCLGGRLPNGRAATAMPSHLQRHQSSASPSVHSAETSKSSRSLGNAPNYLVKPGGSARYDFRTTRGFHTSAKRQQSAEGTGSVVPFKLSDIGEGISEVTIKEWFVKVGDTVSQFDPICEVQSDKASVTITSRYDGVITKLYHEVEGVAKVGSALVDIQLSDADGQSTQEAAAAPVAEPTPPPPPPPPAVPTGTSAAPQQSTGGSGSVVPFKLSDIGEGISEVAIKEWFVKVGDRVSQFDPICEVQSDKASVTITSRYDGVITKLYHEVEGTAKVGSALVDIQLDMPEGDASAASSTAAAEPAPVAPSSPAPVAVSPPAPVAPATPTVPGHGATTAHASADVSKALATPAVRRMAGELKIPLHEVTATGKGGRVLKDDIYAYLEQVKQRQAAPPPPKPISAPQPAPPPRTAPTTASAPPELLPMRGPLEAKSVPLSGYTRAMMKTMTHSLEIPHFGYKDEVDITTLVEVRKEMANEAKKYGVKLSYMPLFIKAASLALQQYPILNGSLSPCKEQMIYKAEHNIGLAMDTPVGLIVPNIKNCQDKSVMEIGAELNRLHAASLAGRVATEDLTGTTFSLSNIGSIGGTYAFPVIVSPSVCIGALGRIRKLPRYTKASDGSEVLAPAHTFNVSWSADHRVIDGATVARFSNLWKEYLEKPHLFLMHLR